MNPFDKQQITTTDSDALKTCIENDGCEPAGVVVTQQSECSLINEKYAKSITINDSIQCGSKVTSFVISGYPNLESITIGNSGMYSSSGYGEVLIENSRVQLKVRIFYSYCFLEKTLNPQLSIVLITSITLLPQNITSLSFKSDCPYSKLI